MDWLRRLFSAPDDPGSRDGSSPRTAILVSQVADEYHWVRQNCPGFTVERQRLVRVDETLYDVLWLRSEAGQMREVFFDLSGFKREG